MADRWNTLTRGHEDALGGELRTMQSDRPGDGAEPRIVPGIIGSVYEDSGSRTYDVEIWDGYPLAPTGEMVEGAVDWGQDSALAIGTRVFVRLAIPNPPVILEAGGGTTALTQHYHTSAADYGTLGGFTGGGY